jgi:two-component SAPR family response regulator
MMLLRVDHLFPAHEANNKQANLMTPHIVVVHDDLAFVEQVSIALRFDGLLVTTFADPVSAWAAVKAAQPELLFTRMRFMPDALTGIALARMAIAARPEIRVLFTSLPELSKHAEGIGAFIPTPVTAEGVAEAVMRLLKNILVSERGVNR